MSLHDGGVRQHPKHDVQVFQMVRRLEDTVRARPLPLQQPEHGEQVAVCPGVILPLQPRCVARYMHRRFRRLTHERKVQQKDILFRGVVPERVNGGKVGRQKTDRLLCEPCQPDPAPGVAWLLTTQRHWIQCLPGAEIPNIRIRGDEPVQGRRRGSLQACNQDNPAQILVEDFGMFPDQVLRA